ncbi:ApeA N-terminal domain 1-containing protein [Streptomyces ardesiacus]|uniref:ApeA N-terminal domain 1-containing protein n=1 Tax=Streptomyces ardesiacus TaxID=285564 RepID=UPI00381CCB22
MEARSGVWWIDRDPNKRVAGTLIRRDGIWILNLVGRLPVDSPRLDELALVPPTTIYGRCLGTRYTLRHAYLKQTNGPSRRFDVPQDDHDHTDDQHSQLWEGYGLLLGEAFPEEALYKAAQFEISGLNEWWPNPRPHFSRRPSLPVGGARQYRMRGWMGSQNRRERHGSYRPLFTQHHQMGHYLSRAG